MSKNLLMRLTNAIIGTGLLQVIPSKASGAKRVSVLCRQIPGQEKTWLASVEHLLHALGEHGDNVLIARRYLLKDGKMVFGWFIELSGTAAEIGATLDIVEESLSDARPQIQQVAVPAAPAMPLPQRQPQEQKRPLAPGQHPQARTRPRAPDADDLIPSEAQLPPEGFSPKIRVIERGRDEKGQPTTVEEMPLPHVYSEMNKPNPKGRGAKLTGGG